jgi:hypothetical protein
MTFCTRFWKTAATIATTPETIVISNAGATMPVMSSPFPRDRTINATIPASIKALMVIAQYFRRLNDLAEDSGNALFISMQFTRLNA